MLACAISDTQCVSFLSRSSLSLSVDGGLGNATGFCPQFPRLPFCRSDPEKGRDPAHPRIDIATPNRDIIATVTLARNRYQPNALLATPLFEDELQTCTKSRAGVVQWKPTVTVRLAFTGLLLGVPSSVRSHSKIYLFLLLVHSKRKSAESPAIGHTSLEVVRIVWFRIRYWLSKCCNAMVSRLGGPVVCQAKCRRIPEGTLIMKMGRRQQRRRPSKPPTQGNAFRLHNRSLHHVVSMPPFYNTHSVSMRSCSHPSGSVVQQRVRGQNDDCRHNVGAVSFAFLPSLTMFIPSPRWIWGGGVGVRNEGRRVAGERGAGGGRRAQLFGSGRTTRDSWIAAMLITLPGPFLLLPVCLRWAGPWFHEETAEESEKTKNGCPGLAMVRRWSRKPLARPVPPWLH
ncbi:hypothetical protein VTK26DRAFT_3521 [Humicola hyalothermophila]